METPQEPLAIAGAGCRFPGGVNDLASYGRLLAGACDAMVQVPPSRWKSTDFHDTDRAAMGKMYARVAGFVSDAEWFDASFFGISAREATSMDPQQRMLLEVAWHALEDAGISPACLRDTRTGVFLGIGSNDYIEREVLSPDYLGINPTSGTGIFPSVAAGRLSFALGLRGPSLAIDAACASSLVALHQAARSLWAGECDVALVAGVNFIVSPASTIYLCKAGALSPDGHCRSFDRAAAGYVRGEGCGVIVLMRSSYARAAGSRVRALLRGSAINHNGASAQLTAPRGDAQEDVMRSALASAGLPGSAVSYIEAHGTASPLGDLIELRSVQRVFCEEERSAPLLVGTVKPHLGHLEAAAGMAGLLKVLVALESEQLSAILHLDEPNPKLPSEGLELLRSARDWRRDQFPRVAGVSAFSLCGTNAHVVLSEAPGALLAASGPLRAEVLTLSAKSEPALRALAAAWVERLRQGSVALTDLCYSANTGRQALGFRAALVGDSHEVMRSALEALVAGEAHPALFVAPAGAARRLDKFAMSSAPEALAAASRSLLGVEPDAALASAHRSSVCRLWAQVFSLGAAVDFAPDYRGQAQRVDIPLYPFQRTFFAAGAPARRGDVQTSAEVTPREPAPSAKAPPEAPAPDEGSELPVNPRIAQESARQIELFLRTWIAQRTSAAADSLDCDEPFAQFGLGSADALELTRALSERLGRELSITLAWDHPCIRLLSAHLARETSPAPARRSTLAERTFGENGGIALVGAACRLPGAADLESYWQLLSEGREAIGPVPEARWSKADYYDPRPGVPGKMYTDRGGFLGEVDAFDAAFFGISSREAASMDPQQRLLLELVWEALEHAGVVPGELAGSATGVYVGIGSYDYAQRRVGTASLTHIDGYAGTGNSGSAASGRIAYLLDLKGPTLSIDTACSSSLVALHVACQALTRGEIDFAIVGGVNLILSPATSIFFCALNALAPDGRCKVFDASADGYVRSEGGVVLVLKRAADAERTGDRTLAVVRGTAVVQDGRTNGLTAPNGASQRAVIERARSAAGVAAEEVGYVEAHGTGTRLGDAIELSALAETAGAARSEPLRVGSLKANLGHTEAAAGLAGVLKVALSLHRRQIPPQINLVTPSAEASWDDGRLAVETALAPWPEVAPFAGVSSFGFTGTNAHAVLAAGSPGRSAPAAVARPHVLTLSARSEASLERLLQRYAAAGGPLDGEADAARIAYSAAVRRSHHRQRVAVLGDTARALRETIAAELAGSRPEALVRGTAGSAAEGALVFVFPGQGGQWTGMGRELYASDPAFRAVLNGCHEAMAPHLRVPLLEILGIAPAQDRPFPTETELVQPALSAVQMAHAAMWRARGVEPAAVIGHSMGEVAAAYVAGALDLSDAARVICVRSHLLGKLRGRGAMALVAAPHSRVERDLANMNERVSVAAANGPLETVVTGDAAAIDELVARWQREALFCRRVEVDVASHSPQVEPLLERLAGELACLRPRDTAVTFFSTVRAAPVAGSDLSAAYWVRNLRDTVRFAAALERALDAGHTAFLELGAHPSLGRAVRQNAEARGARVVCVATEERGGSSSLTVSRSLATLYTAGMTPSWLAAEAPQPLCELPTYPFDRKRHWLEEPRSAREEDGTRHERLYYEVRWQPASASRAGEGLGAARWLVLGDAETPLDGVAMGLRAAGSEVTHALSSEQHGDYTRLIERLRVAGALQVVCPAPVGFAAGGNGSAQALLDEAVRGCEWLLGLCRAVKAAGAALWLVTCRAQQVIPGDVPSLTEATLAGLASVVALEEASLVSAIVDGDGTVESERAIAAWLLSGHQEDVAVRAGRQFVPRLRRAARPREAAPALDPEATYLVTGGFGHLGLKVARWLAERGARRVWLVGRRLPQASEAVEGVLGELSAKGVTVTASALDIGDESALAFAIAGLPAEHPLRGVVHCAGLQRAHDALVCDGATLREVLHPKLAGGYALHRATEHLSLDFFALFSSAASIWGSTQAGAYAAANRSLDALAHRRRCAGLPATSVNWGRWPSGGVVNLAAERAFDALGLLELSEEDAFLALTAAIESGQAQTTVAAVDWSKFRPLYEARGPRPLLHALPVADAAKPSVPSATISEPAALQRESAFTLRLRSMPAGRRASALSEATRTKIAQLLGLGVAGQVSDREGFFQMGLNSLMALELKDHLERELGTTLASTLAFEHPTVAALVAHLDRTLFTGSVEPTCSAMAENCAAAEVAHLPAPAAPLDELSDDQLSDLLARKLSSAREKF